MGDKTEARRSMIAAGVPLHRAPKVIWLIWRKLFVKRRVSVTVMLKATSGGGGRGIRRCNSPEELEQAYPRLFLKPRKPSVQRKCFWKNASLIQTYRSTNSGRQLW